MKKREFRYQSQIESISGKSVKGKYEAIVIEGVAAQSITSRNGVTYLPEELKKAVGTLVGKNIGLNHDGDVMDNVGSILEAWFDENTKQVLYRAEVMNTDRHPGIVSMIENKLI